MSSQKANNSENAQPIYTIPPVIIASSLAIVAVLVVSFTLYHFCRNCFLNITYMWQFQRSATETLVRVSPNTSTPSSPYKGFDPSLLHSFPMFLYALVKNLQTEKNNILECAICLLEFEENSMLRLLPNCYHVFHPCCIDLWLHSHKTCPICRNNLDPATNETRKCNEIGKGNTEERRGEVTIEVKEGDGDQRHISDEVVSMNVTEGKMFVQSHSTGHSTMMIREGDDKHKLQLRANVEFLKKDMVTQRVSSYKDIVMNAPYPEAIH